MPRLLSLLCVAALPHCAVSAFTSFSASYSYEGDTYTIQGLEPQGMNNDNPVFLWFMGTGDSHAAPVDITWLESMAARGFMAASVDYPNDLGPLLCGLVWGSWESISQTWKDKATKIVPAALDAVCSQARADCSAGVAISGHSQGGFITVFGVQAVAGRVTAVLPLGIGCMEGEVGDPALLDSEVSQFLAQDKRLIVTGGADDLYDENCMRELSGSSSAAISIGPGFMKVPEGAHGFYGEHEWSISTSRMKCAYRDGNEAWALNSVLDWLAAAASTNSSQVSSATLNYSHECVDSLVSDSPAGEDHSLPLCLIFPILAMVVGFLCCCCGLCGGVCFCYKKKKCCFKT